YAWLRCQLSQRITRHNTSGGQPLDPDVEGRVGGHILEGLLGVRVCEACCLGDYLGYLATSGVVVWPEVRPVVGWYARLTWQLAAWVATDYTTRCQPLDVDVEGRA